MVLNLIACAAPKGPLVNTCLSKPDVFGLECVDTQEKAYFVHYANSDKYVCYAPQDHKMIVDWINAQLKRMRTGLKVTGGVRRGGATQVLHLSDQFSARQDRE